VPACFGHIDSVVFGGSFDVGEGLFALVVGNVFDLIEASNGVTDVGGVGERLFALVWERVGCGGKFVALLCVEGFVVFMVLPGCFHGGLQFRGKMAACGCHSIGWDLRRRCCESTLAWFRDMLLGL
jgi:hypothetical protein